MALCQASSLEEVPKTENEAVQDFLMASFGLDMTFFTDFVGVSNMRATDRCGIDAQGLRG
jgi:hypothetical protein